MATSATNATTTTKTSPELATSYAALILADSSVTITPDKLLTLIKAAGIEDVEPIWATLFAKALEGKDIKDLVTTVTTTVTVGGVTNTQNTGCETGGGGGGEADGGKDIGLGDGDGSEGSDSDAEEGIFDLFG